MSWPGWLLIAAALYVIVVLVRAAINFIRWAYDEYIVAPREWRRIEAKRRAPAEPAGAAAPACPGRTLRTRIARTKAKLDRRAGPPAAPRSSINVAAGAPTRTGLAEFVKRLLAKKTFDSWVTFALTERDPRKKADYCARALKLNPAYLPAWGMKGAALFDLHRYGEAIECLDRVLQAHPNAMVWHHKGLCCHHLKRYQEAIDCFNKAIATCPESDRELYEMALRDRKLAQEAVSGQGAARIE
jgi:tetratricopeptide (TPR) repeat protein